MTDLGNSQPRVSFGHPGGWLFCLIVLGAAVARFWNLEHLPDGFHGDEAWTGLDARRILREGWIGPYVPSALGQPSGLLYFVAGLFLWLPDEVATVRLGIAVIGLLGIVFTYLVAREYEGSVVAACAAALLAASLWHLHGSRIGMMFISCPTFLMAGLWAQAVALRRRTHPCSLLAGFVAGLGIYSYNAYPTALPLYAIPFAHAWAATPIAPERRRLGLHARIFLLAALATVAPMIEFAARDPAFFFRHHQQVSVYASPAWIEADLPARVAILAARARFWFEGIFLQGRFDPGDGFGSAGIALVDPVTGCLAAVGLVLAALRWRRPGSMLMLAAGPVLALGALLTAGPGAFRRTIAFAPFIAMLAATALHEVYRAGTRWSEQAGRRTPRVAATALVTALVVAAAAINLRTYFGPFVNDRQLRWVYARELHRASEYLAGVPAGMRVYFFSERWSCNYETRRYLAPGIDCVDRSRRFGNLKSRSGLLDFSAPSGKPALLFLMGEHLRQLDILARRYPDAKRETGELNGEIIYAAVYLPEGVARSVGVAKSVGDDGRPVLSLTALQPIDVRYDFEPPRVNQTWNGHPLVIGERKFSRGLGMHAPTEVVYAVPARATKLVTDVGLSALVADCAKASVVFEILDGRGQLLAASGVLRPGDPPHRLRADVRRAKRVTLVASDAGDGRDCDHANWGNPVFRREPQKNPD